MLALGTLLSPAHLATHLSSELAALVVPTAVGLPRSSSTPLVATTTPTSTAVASDPALLIDATGGVAIHVTSTDVARTTTDLEALGFRTTATFAAQNFVEGFLPAAELANIDRLTGSGLLGVTAVHRPVVAAGSVTSQGDNLLEAARTRGALPAGYDGTGLTVGVLSDSYNNLNGEAAGIASGDLPAAGVHVLSELASGGTDEGRAMLEIVHDVAPGASLAFASAFNGEADFAQQIRNLADPALGHAQIIVDDVAYLDEPFFQDGIVAQAVDDVVTNRGVAYFSAAGNQASKAYETTSFDPVTVTTSITVDNTTISGGIWHDFDPGPGTDLFQRLTIQNGQKIQFVLQWDDPFYTTSGVTRDIDIYLTNAVTGQVVAQSIDDNPGSQTPLEYLAFTNNTTTTTTTQFNVLINLYSGPTPTRLRYVNYGSNITINEYATNSPTAVGHAAAAHAEGVGAVPFYLPQTAESFTSAGPTTILFTAAGVPLATPEVRQTPRIAATDGGDTTFFGFDISSSFENPDNTFKNFFGTSAAAPHAAAVAALVLQANLTFTPAQLYQRLESTADASVGSPGIDNLTGYGLIDAYRAVFGGPQPASVPYAADFASGDLGTAWEVHATGGGQVHVVNTGVEQYVALDNTANVFNALKELTLHVNALGQTNVTLAFREKELSSDADDPMSASFTGSDNSDGVALSVDGTTWYRIVSLTGASSTSDFQSFSFNLTQLAASLGLVLGGDTRIRLQNFGAAGISGFAFDDVNLAASPALAVQSVVVNDGGAQRSMVTSLTVTLTGTATTIDDGAFALASTTGASGTLLANAVVSTVAGKTVVVLTFGGTLVDSSGSLVDGRYALSIDGTKIHDAFGFNLDADGDGTLGGMRVDSLFRFLGDSEGDGDVDNLDYARFRNSFGTQAGDAAYRAFFDSDSDGDIDTLDYARFRQRYSQRFLP